jgi:hypothetical protein
MGVDRAVGLPFVSFESNQFSHTCCHRCDEAVNLRPLNLKISIYSHNTRLARESAWQKTTDKSLFELILLPRPANLIFRRSRRNRPAQKGVAREFGGAARAFFRLAFGSEN